MKRQRRLTLEAEKLTDKIGELLHGRGPEIQGAALADLVAIFFAGHHPALREESIEHWITCMRNLIPVNEAILFDRHGGRPEGWGTQ
jgi:hypothetical protein